MKELPLTPSMKRVLLSARKRLGLLTVAGLTLISLGALAALTVGVSLTDVLVVAVVTAMAVVCLTGLAQLTIVVRRELLQVRELSALVPLVRSLDSHIGATRRQLRVAIEQELSMGETKRTLRIHGRDIRRLRNRIWAGFEVESIEELERYQYARGIDRQSRAAASVVLASWNHAYREPQDAYRAIALTRVHQASAERPLEHDALEADLLTEMGRLDEAREVLESASEAFGWVPELCLRVATTRDPADPANDSTRLEELNRALGSVGLAQLAKRDESQPLTLANLRAIGVECRRKGVDTPLVSVIMPMRNSEETVGYAIQSVLEQTWEHLQVIVVDDGSDDATVALVKEFSSVDSRVEVYTREAQGAYAARNFGLSQCRGQYVTVHDADDWSHPEKLERQVESIEQSSESRASWSYWIRCSHDLAFCAPSLRAQYRQIVRNYSSLMLDRSVFSDLGTWDEATVSSDGEFVDRLEAFYGSGAAVEVLPEVPLSFGLRTEQSLTASGATGILSIHHVTGARRQYRETYRAWHSGEAFHSTLPLDLRSSVPFSRPRLLDPVRRQQDEPCDIAIVGDLSDEGGRGEFLEVVARALVDQNLRVGLAHLPASRHNSSPRPELLRALDRDSLRLVSSGEIVEVGAVLVDDASLLQSPLARAPQLVSKTEPRVVVRRATDGLDPERVNASLGGFGLTTAAWYAANPTLLPGLHQLVTLLVEGHTIGDDLWRAEPALLTEEVPIAIPRIARVRVSGLDSDANTRLAMQIEESARLCLYGKDIDLRVGQTGHAETAGDEEALGLRSHDVLVLGADEPVDHDVLLEALGSTVAIVADDRWSNLLGDMAMYSHSNGAVAAIEAMMRDPERWQSQHDNLQRRVRERCGPQAVAGVLGRQTPAARGSNHPNPDD